MSAQAILGTAYEFAISQRLAFREFEAIPVASLCSASSGSNSVRNKTTTSEVRTPLSRVQSRRNRGIDQDKQNRLQRSDRGRGLEMGIASDGRVQDNARTALVTGGTGGMGRVIAGKLAADGFDVAVAHAGDIDAAEATVGEIEEHGRRGMAAEADVTDEKAVSELFAVIDDSFGHLDVVVNMAGINRPAALVDLDLGDFDAIHRVNVRGTFVVNQQAARRLRDGGAMVNVSSSMVRFAPPGLSAYAASKSAVETLTRILAKELRGRDITVNAVAPGPTATPAFLASTPPDDQKELAALPPLERLGRSDDIAGVVSFLVGPSGRWVNGQVVYANGGFV